MTLRYGIIGNCKTAALVHESGSIDWCCMPNFDSPSAFAGLLDPEGGHFKVSSAGKANHIQRYIPKTNILETEFDDGDNAFVATDFMPRYRDGAGYKRPVEIYRLLRPIKFSLSVTMPPMRTSSRFCRIRHGPSVWVWPIREPAITSPVIGRF